jgi:hypothetical protein
MNVTLASTKELTPGAMVHRWEATVWVPPTQWSVSQSDPSCQIQVYVGRLNTTQNAASCRRVCIDKPQGSKIALLELYSAEEGGPWQAGAQPWSGWVDIDQERGCATYKNWSHNRFRRARVVAALQGVGPQSAPNAEASPATGPEPIAGPGNKSPCEAAQLFLSSETRGDRESADALLSLPDDEVAQDLVGFLRRPGYVVSKPGVGLDAADELLVRALAALVNWQIAKCNTSFGAGVARVRVEFPDFQRILPGRTGGVAIVIPSSSNDRDQALQLIRERLGDPAGVPKVTHVLPAPLVERNGGWFLGGTP